MFGEQVAQLGFRGLGDTFAQTDRPSFDYVRAGDVIRVRVFLDATHVYAPPITAFRNRLSSDPHLRTLIIDSSQLGGIASLYAGPLIVEVQPLVDFARLDDVVRRVAGTAQGAGLQVLASGTRGEFVSKVEATAGNVPSNIPQPAPPGSDRGSNGDGAFDSLGDFVKSLTQSPVTLAVLAGAAVILVIAAKK